MGEALIVPDVRRSEINYGFGSKKLLTSNMSKFDLG
jgi:hypothetical protein